VTSAPALVDVSREAKRESREMAIPVEVPVELTKPRRPDGTSTGSHTAIAVQG